MSRYASPDDTVQIVIRNSGVGLELCLVSRSNDVTDDRLGIPHTGVKEPAYSRAAMVTLRDPDNIQLELYWPG